MPVDLSRVNISLQQFQSISSGKYNAGEVKLASATRLDKMNHHVRQRFRNDEMISHQAVIAIKEALVKALSQHGFDAKEIGKGRRELGLAPDGADYMRAPAGTKRETLAFNVVDQVMPVPYDGGALNSVLQSGDWLAALSSGDSAATIRRHSTKPVLGGAVTSTRLVGRSVWNDRWLLVIPASSLSSDRVAALKTFIEGLDTDKDGQIDVPGVSDIELGFRAYSRSGN